MVRRWVNEHWGKVYSLAMLLLFMKLAAEDTFNESYFSLAVSTFCLFYFAWYLRREIMEWLAEEDHAANQYDSAD